VCVCVFYLIL